MNNTSRKATSIAEAMVVMLIVTVGVVWMFKVYINSQRLSNTTANKIQAIQIAREWIEAMKNIRETNWVLYWADSANCWNTSEYSSNCVWDTTNTHDIISTLWENFNYKIYRKPNNRWFLTPISSISPSPWSKVFSNDSYRGEAEVFTDNNWFYTQTGTLWTSKFKLKPLFTREIQIKYLQADWVTLWNSNDPKMQVTSLVQWSDSSNEQKPHKVKLTTLLTNWHK